MTFESVVRPLAGAIAVLFCVALPASAQTPAKAPAPPPPPAVATVPGMPAVPNAANLYSETAADKLSPAVAGDLPRVYVPHVQSNDVYVIDPATFKVVDKFKVGLNPQHVVPSWDLQTLWVANNAESTTKGSLIPDRSEDRQGRARRSRSTIRTTCTSRPTASRRSWSPRRRSGSTSATRRRWRCSTRSTCRAAPASTTRTSRSTAGTRSSPASSQGTRRQDRPRQPQGAGLHPGDPARTADEDRHGAGRQGRDHLHDVEGDAAGHPRLAGRQAVLRRRHDGRRRPRHRRRDLQGRSASSRPARARTASIRAATARSSTSPIAAPTRSTAAEGQGQRVRASTSRPSKVEATWPIPGGGSPDMGNVSADGK